MHISALALLKMAMHAKSGGNIEVMGMLQGKVIGREFVVVDAFALPVEGTETRVNAQTEAYEYMVDFAETTKVCRCSYSHSYAGTMHLVTPSVASPRLCTGALQTLLSNTSALPEGVKPSCRSGQELAPRFKYRQNALCAEWLQSCAAGMPVPFALGCYCCLGNHGS